MPKRSTAEVEAARLAREQARLEKAAERERARLEKEEAARQAKLRKAAIKERKRLIDLMQRLSLAPMSGTNPEATNMERRSQSAKDGMFKDGHNAYLFHTAMGLLLNDKTIACNRGALWGITHCDYELTSAYARTALSKHWRFRAKLHRWEPHGAAEVLQNDYPRAMAEFEDLAVHAFLPRVAAETERREALLEERDKSGCAKFLGSWCELFSAPEAPCSTAPHQIEEADPALTNHYKAKGEPTSALFGRCPNRNGACMCGPNVAFLYKDTSSEIGCFEYTVANDLMHFALAVKGAVGIRIMRELCMRFHYNRHCSHLLFARAFVSVPETVKWDLLEAVETRNFVNLEWIARRWGPEVPWVVVHRYKSGCEVSEEKRWIMKWVRTMYLDELRQLKECDGSAPAELSEAFTETCAMLHLFEFFVNHGEPMRTAVRNYGLEAMAGARPQFAPRRLVVERTYVAGTNFSALWWTTRLGQWYRCGRPVSAGILRLPRSTPVVVDRPELDEMRAAQMARHKAVVFLLAATKNRTELRPLWVRIAKLGHAAGAHKGPLFPENQARTHAETKALVLDSPVAELHQRIHTLRGIMPRDPERAKASEAQIEEYEAQIERIEAAWDAWERGERDEPDLLAGGALAPYSNAGDFYSINEREANFRGHFADVARASPAALELQAQHEETLNKVFGKLDADETPCAPSALGEFANEFMQALIDVGMSALHTDPPHDADLDPTSCVQLSKRIAAQSGVSPGDLKWTIGKTPVPATKTT